MATQLMVDLYDCNQQIIDCMEGVREIARRVIDEIGAEIVEECCHKFQPIGVTYIAVITTSHFSIHTWPEYGYVAVDIFSCKEDLPEQVALKLKQEFSSRTYKLTRIDRDIKGGEKSEI